MPNHVTNIIRASKEVLDFLRDGDQHAITAGATADLANISTEVAEQDDKPEVDFNNVVPQPADLYQGGVEFGKDYGVPTWYDWNPINWGTKWNAYSIERLNDTTVKFETAWSHPTPILDTLSEKFENEPIAVLYADEDFGYNVGKYVILGGERTQDDTPEGGSFEAYDLAARVLYDQSILEHLAEEREDYTDEEWAEYYGPIEEEAKRRAAETQAVTE